MSPKAKGEEKPEEELMGIVKSSPRLATTSAKDAVIFHYGQFLSDYTWRMTKNDGPCMKIAKLVN